MAAQGSANRLQRPRIKTTGGRVLPAKFSPSRVVRPSGFWVRLVALGTTASADSCNRSWVIADPRSRRFRRAQSQVSLSKDVNSCCTAGAFISGAEHWAVLCGASSPAPSTLYALGLARRPLAWPCGPSAPPNSFRACPRRSSLFVGSSALTGGFLPTEPHDSAVASV